LTLFPLYFIISFLFLRSSSFVLTTLFFLFELRLLCFSSFLLSFYFFWRNISARVALELLFFSLVFSKKCYINKQIKYYFQIGNPFSRISYCLVKELLELITWFCLGFSALQFVYSQAMIFMSVPYPRFQVLVASHHLDPSKDFLPGYTGLIDQVYFK